MALPDGATTLPRTPPGRASLRLDPGAQSAALGRRMALVAMALLLSAVAGFAVVRVNPLIVFGLVLAALFLLVVLRWPYVGLLVYVVVYVSRVGEVYPVLAPLRLERMVGVLTLVSFVMAQLRARGELAFDHSKQTRRFLLLLLAAAATIPLSYWRVRSVNATIELAKIFLFYLMVVQLVDSKRRFRIFFFLYGALICYLAITSMVDYFRGSLLFAQGIDRAVGKTSAGGGPNEMGATMASMIPVFLLLGTHGGLRGWRYVFLLGLLSLVITLAITGSRSGFLGFLVGMTYLWWTSKRRLLYGTIGFVLMIGGFAALPDQYKGRYETITSNKLDGSSSDRLKVWKKGMEMVADRPLTGVGIGCFGTANALSYSTTSGHRASYLESHSLYVQVPAEMGLVGVVAFFGFLIFIMRFNRRTARAMGTGSGGWEVEWLILKGIFAGFAALLMTGVFGHSLMRHTWYLYAAMGLTVARLYLDRDSDVSSTEREALLG